MKATIQILATIVLISFIAVPGFSAAVVDRTPEGVAVGEHMLPDTLPFDPGTLDELTCLAPTTKRPMYEIAIPIGDWDGGSGASVDSLTINGVKCRVFNIYSDGRAHLHSGWITHQGERAENVVVLAKALWRNGERIVAEVSISHSSEPDNRTIVGTAPARGGMAPGPRHYESFALVEEAGVDRDREPCEISVSVYPDEVLLPDDEGGLAGELRLYRIGGDGEPVPVAIQVFDVGGVPGVPRPDDSFYLYSPSRTARIFFFADVEAHGAAIYVITYGDPSPPPPPEPESTLEIQGEAPGFTISNAFYTCTLDPSCGQILGFEFRGEGSDDLPVLTNHLTRAMHWNPDSYGSNGKWGHTFAWDPPDLTAVAAQGPLLLRITNSGRMPDETPQVYASVSYSFYSDSPYIGVATMMEVRDRYSASALRNGELVLDTHLMTHFVWKDKAGQINRIPTQPQASVLDDLAVMTEPDVPWLAMTNELDGYGLAAVWTTAEAFHRDLGTRPVHRPGYFLYSHHGWSVPLTYFTRAWVYPFAYKGRRPNIMIEPGAVFLERGAFYPFLFEPGSAYEEVEEVNTVLTQPLIRRTGN